MKYIVFALIVVLLLAGCSSGGDNLFESTPAGQPTSVPVPTTVPTAPTGPTASPTPQAAALSDLSLVYVDSSKGQGAELFVAAYDGANPRKVTNLTGGNRVYDVRGNNLVASGTNQLLFIDLKSGATRPLAVTGNVRDGRFVDDQTFIYTIANGCGPNGGPRGVIYRVNVSTLQQSELASSPDRDYNLSSIDTAFGQLAVILRGCDVAVRQMQVISLTDGKLIQTYDTEGCGWAVFALAQRKAIVSRQFCTQPADKQGVDATIYDVAGIVPSAKDVSAPNGGASLRTFVLRPGRAEAALGTASRGPAGPGPAPSTGTGIWLLDINTLAFSNLAGNQGSEQWAIGWSPDGQYLLAAATVAQGMCAYTYIDVASKDVKPIAPAVTFCGANGDVVGWSTIK